MAQIASLLAVATVLLAYGLQYLHVHFLIHETKLSVQELELKVQRERGLCARGGGRNCGILRYMYFQVYIIVYVHVYHTLYTCKWRGNQFWSGHAPHLPHVSTAYHVIEN